jgi:hypothetical protein
MSSCDCSTGSASTTASGCCDFCTKLQLKSLKQIKNRIKNLLCTFDREIAIMTDVNAPNSLNAINYGDYGVFIGLNYTSATDVVPSSVTGTNDLLMTNGQIIKVASDKSISVILPARYTKKLLGCSIPQCKSNISSIVPYCEDTGIYNLYLSVESDGIIGDSTGSLTSGAVWSLISNEPISAGASLNNLTVMRNAVKAAYTTYCAYHNTLSLVCEGETVSSTNC